jgi:hypothetical protein
VRLERDLAAAKGVQNVEKEKILSARLATILAENEKRLAIVPDEAKRIQMINERNRAINIKRDHDARLTNKEQMESMSAAQKLQYVRASSSRRMMLSRDKIEKHLADGKLIQLDDGRIMTVNKTQEIEALPDNLVAEPQERKKMTPMDRMEKSLRLKQLQERKEEEGGGGGGGGGGGEGRDDDDVEEDVEGKFHRDGHMTKEKHTPNDRSDHRHMVDDVEFIGEKPVHPRDIANVAIRFKEEDGTWMRLRPAVEILKEQQMKQCPVIPEADKRKRKGLSMQEYFDRVKRREMEHA